MFAFTIVWAGQLVSSLGSRMTAFALMIWVWQRTGEATSLALIGFFAFVPAIVVLPFAGSFVDRWNRKLTMILSDLSAGIGTVVILVLYMAGSLEIWHIYIVMLFAGAFGAFQFPAYSAAVTTMVEKKHFARASAMLSMVGSVSGIFGPPLAAVLLVFIGIEGVMSIDIALTTFTFIFPADDHNFVIFFKPHHWQTPNNIFRRFWFPSDSVYRTSGAREIIFIKFRARNSRATGPKIRVPTGSF